MYNWVFPIQFSSFSSIVSSPNVTQYVWSYIHFDHYDNYHAYLITRRPDGGTSPLQNRVICIGY